MEETQMMQMSETMERLVAAATALEHAMERMNERSVAIEAEAQECVGRIVATVETAREAELMRKLEAAEAAIVQLQAAAASGQQRMAGRKTLPASMANMLAKQGVVVDSMEAGALDGALASLSVEQRIAVKAELMRAGLLG